MKYTLIILNFNRPNNVKYIIDHIKNYENINEIIISNGKKETSIESPKHLKVKYRSDYIINNIYGLDLRFLTGIEAQNSNLIMMDDDILISEKNLQQLIDTYESNKNCIVGIFGRKVENNLYIAKNIYGLVDIVLTRIMIMPKYLCKIYFAIKPVFWDIFEQGEPKGNGEDILISYISLYYHKRQNYTINIKVTNLSHEHAISSKPNHYIYRNKLCKTLNDRAHLLDYIIKKMEKDHPEDS